MSPHASPPHPPTHLCVQKKGGVRNTPVGGVEVGVLSSVAVTLLVHPPQPSGHLGGGGAGVGVR